MDDVTRERALDAMVMRRLRTDRRYLNAENADEQAEAEEVITAECEAELDAAESRRRALGRLIEARAMLRRCRKGDLVAFQSAWAAVDAAS